MTRVEEQLRQEGRWRRRGPRCALLLAFAAPLALAALLAAPAHAGKKKGGTQSGFQSYEHVRR